MFVHDGRLATLWKKFWEALHASYGFLFFMMLAGFYPG